MYRPLQSWCTRMSVTIGEITSEVIVEPERQLGGGVALANQPKDLATIPPKPPTHTETAKMWIRTLDTAISCWLDAPE